MQSRLEKVPRHVEDWSVKAAECALSLLFGHLSRWLALLANTGASATVSYRLGALAPL